MPRFNDLTTGSVNYGADVRKRIINVDSVYRESASLVYDISGNPTGNRVTDFLFRLTTPVRNVSEMKVVSVEVNGLVSGQYVLLQINDESSIESKGGILPSIGTTGTVGTEVRAVAKILTGQGSAFLTEATGLISYPVSFRSPQDFTVLRVKIVNPDGTVTDSSSGTVSFTLELTEVVNSYLYESNRKHIGYDPANVRS
jgi:hypothetical protein